jgi:hypothetical protein
MPQRAAACSIILCTYLGLFCPLVQAGTVAFQRCESPVSFIRFLKEKKHLASLYICESQRGGLRCP